MTTAEKTSLGDLKVFGGPAAFAKSLHVGKPNIGNREALHKRLDEILDRGWLTNNGPVVSEFEQRIAGLAGTKYCVATTNGTIALELAIRALGMGGEVIVPSFTFAATAHALQWQQVTPVFCDIESENYTIDPARIEELITPRTTGIIGVHLWGRACDVVGLTEIARRRNLKLLFDASHAVGCSTGGRMIGGFGDAEVFSFHATKFLNSFEGGAIVTNDEDLASRLKLMKNFGFVGFDRVDHVGTNGKMTEICAAMGITSLESMMKFVEANYRNYDLYRKYLQDIEGVRLLLYDRREKNNYQYIVVEIDEAATGISRDSVMAVLMAENVLARRYFYPSCHNMEPYKSYYPQARMILPVTEAKMRQTLALPTGVAVSEADIKGIADVLAFTVNNGAAVTERLLEDSAIQLRIPQGLSVKKKVR